MEALDYGRSIWAVELPLSTTAEDSIETSWASEDSSATVATVPLALVPEVSASTRSATHNWSLSGLSFGLLLLNSALGLSLYNGIFYEWAVVFGLLLLSLTLGLSLYQGRVAIQPPEGCR